MKSAVVTFFAWLVVVASSARGAERPTAPPKDSTALQFRRVYVQEGVKDWPKGDVKYLPMDGREFERLVAQIQRKSARLPTQSAAGFIQSQYECRLSGQSLLQGSGTLEVSSAISGGMLMTLDPCNLAIDHAQWITSDGAPAVIGASSDGHLQVLAERAGQMRFDWSLAGQRDSAGASSFAIQLPPCSVNRMRIDLPADSQPFVDHGVLTEEGPGEPGIRRWNIELGGWSGCRLHVSKKGGETQQQRPFLADQSTAYDISLRGLEVIADLNVAAHRGTLAKITLEIDPSLELLEVSAGSQSLRWSPLGAPDDKLRYAVVELPAEMQQTPARLQFRAIAPLIESKAWTLPYLMVQGAISRTNTMRLAVSSPLCVASLIHGGCRQTGASLLKSRPGERFDFDVNDPKINPQIVLTRRHADAQAVCATATVLGQGKMSSRVAADFRTSEGPIFALSADILPNWSIDSIASQPADALDNWAPEGSAGSPQIAIQLARPLTPARPVRLIVLAHRFYGGPGRNLNVPLSMEDIVPLRFTAPIESRRLVDLRAGGVNELRLAVNGQSSRADVKELTPAELDLFTDPPGDMLLRDNGGSSSVRFTLTSRKPTLSADIRLEAVVSQGVLEENYTFSCAPVKTAPIDRLIVHLTGHRSNPLRWSLGGLDETRLLARRWPAARVIAAGFNSNDEVWEVVLGSRRSNPFELRASRRTNIGGTLPLCLASLPDAATQQASVLIRSLGPQAIQIKARRALPMPVEADQAGQIQTARAAYRYDPREEAIHHLDPAIVVTSADRTTPNAWAWDCDIRSRFAASGAGDHQITYKIENAGSRQVNLRLPPPLGQRDLREILINKKPAAAYVADAGSEELTINLPTNVKELDLSLRISTVGEPLRTFRRLLQPNLEIGLPVLARHWSIELPPGYTTLSDGDEPNAADATNVRRRFLGILGRDENQSLFDPFHRSEWRDLFRPARTENQRDGSRAAEMAGWLDSRVNHVNSSAFVTVIYEPAIAVAGCLLFLAVVAVGSWPPNGRPLVLTVLAIICGIFALLLPEAIAGAFSGGLLAVPFCLLVALARKPNFAAKSRGTSVSRELPSTLTNVVPYGAPVLVAIVLSCAGPVRAGQPQDALAPQSVFIPVNDKQEPTGGKFLLSESFFSELYRRASMRAEKPQGWLIASATYRAALAEDVAIRAFAVDRLTAEFEIHVFDASTRVRIPIHGDEISLVPDRAQLDDRPIQPDWDADRSALLVDIAEPGEYRLELTLRPNVRPESRGGFEMSIPRVPSARLEVTAPPGSPPVSIPTARGAVRWELIPSRWIAELGPADRLAVRWQDASTDTDEPIDVQQLQWLKIEQGCVLLNVRLKAKSLSDQSRRVQLKTDSSLELLPDPTAVTQPIVTPESDTKQTIDCLMPSSSNAATVLDLRFLCTAAPSVGIIPAPQLEVVGSRSNRHLLAVSVDRSLRYQSHGGRAPEPGTVQEFVDSWGNGESVPDLVFRLNEDAADWTITTHVRDAETSGNQTVTWSFDADEAQVRFDALLVTESGSAFQYGLKCPPSLHVDSLAVTSDGREIPSRWIANDDSHLTVFLDGAVTGRHQLQLRGNVSVPRNRKFDLPQFRLEDVRVQNSVVRLYRRPAVDVDVSAATGLAEIKAAEEGGPAEIGQPLRSYYLDPAKGGMVSVSIKPLRLPPPPEIAADVPHAAAQTQLSPGAARVVAANVGYVVQPDGRRIGAAVLDVETPAAVDYPLVIPDGFRLLHLTVDGVPVDEVSDQSGASTGSILLHAPRSKVEVLFVANSAALENDVSTRSRINFPSPRLGDLPVDSTTWTVAAPRGMEAIAADVGGKSIAPNPTTNDASDLAADWRRFAADSGIAVSYTASGSPDSMFIGYRESDTSNWHWRLAAAIALIAVAIPAVTLVRCRPPMEWLFRRPIVVGIVLGLTWWLWASPSALGLALVAAILVRQLVFRLRRSRARTPSAAL
jgi:hypothetical protein